MPCDLLLFEHSNPEDMAKTVARAIAVACEMTLVKNKRFKLALSGGNTPQLCYHLLAKLPVDWTRVDLFFCDERCMPVGHNDRNDTMIRNILSNPAKIPESNIYAIQAELGPETGARLYQELLQRHMPLDFAVLGMGEDGHTASLFPGISALKSGDLAIPVMNSPKPPKFRVSLGIKAINATLQKSVMISGTEKQNTLKKVIAGQDLPAAQICGAQWHYTPPLPSFPQNQIRDD